MSHVLTKASMRCPATGKAAFVDEERALRELERALTSERWENVHGHQPSRVYRCAKCGWWHLTSKRSREESSA